jgi:hypothetical protein
MPKRPLTITTDIKELHNLLVQRQVTKDNTNNAKIEELQRRVDKFFYGC